MCDSEYEDINIEATTTTSPQTLKRLKNHRAYKYVGITTSPSGNPKESIIALQKICNEFAHNIQKASILPKEAHSALHAIFMPKIQYQLPSYCISEKSMMKLQTSYEQYIIAKMRYNRHWPKELWYGQHNLGTFQLPHIYMEQTVQQNMTLERTLTSPETAP